MSRKAEEASFTGSVLVQIAIRLFLEGSISSEIGVLIVEN